jgi:mRNA-degrading endonuclease YafQ of YafQ-DinJ toxin-antitoxin module
MLCALYDNQKNSKNASKALKEYLNPLETDFKDGHALKFNFGYLLEVLVLLRWTSHSNRLKDIQAYRKMELSKLGDVIFMLESESHFNPRFKDFQKAFNRLFMSFYMPFLTVGNYSENAENVHQL